MLNDASADKVSMSVRVNAGSAFDPQGKEGVMKLLAANIFPNPEIKEYFADELGGSLDIESNYDFIQVSATAKPDKLLTMMEALSTAVSNVPVDKETTVRLKTVQLKHLEDLAKDPSYVADQAAASRLLGTFPYGRPIDGTTASVQKIDFADLLLAKERFFTADNATVIIAGKFDSDLAYRAARRYLGSWVKADKLVPSTFRQPDPPPVAVQMTESPAPDRFEVRYITRGTSRGSVDVTAFSIVARILETRLRRLIPNAKNGEIRVVSGTYVLPGTFAIAFSGEKDLSRPKVEASDLMPKILGAAITDAEFQTAKQAALADAQKAALTDRWLDVDTYKVSPPAKQNTEAAAVSIADAQRVLERLQNQPFATVVVSSAKSAS